MRFIFLLWMCVELSACQQPRSLAPQLTAEEIQAEERAQQRMVDDIKAQGGQPKRWKNHPNMRRQFEEVGQRIERAGADICRELHLQEHGCYYYFRLNRSEELNAHADGQNIVIYTGLMRFVENDDELATVMGHEFVHNLMGHVEAEKHNALVGSIVGAAVDAVAASQGWNTQGGMAKAGAEVGVLSYSVDFEQEADYVGLYVMARAGFDVQKAPMLWRRMSIENPDAIYNARTHPSNAARFVALQKTIYEIGYKRKHRLPLLPDIKPQEAAY